MAIFINSPWYSGQCSRLSYWRIRFNSPGRLGNWQINKLTLSPSSPSPPVAITKPSSLDQQPLKSLKFSPLKELLREKECQAIHMGEPKYTILDTPRCENLTKPLIYQMYMLIHIRIFVTNGPQYMYLICNYGQVYKMVFMCVLRIWYETPQFILFITVHIGSNFLN